MRECADNIIFIGFASTGKTAVGKVLAEKLGFSFIDLDVEVEKLHMSEKGVGRRCREIFSLFGRECFVRYESKALDRLMGIERSVLSVGGGTPVDKNNRETIRKIGVAVYLQASPKAVVERMKYKGFPEYLGNNPSIDDVAAMMAERESYYLETADFIVDNTGLSPEETACAVIDELATGGRFRKTLCLEKKDPSP
jgi:shikimate kinase